MMTGAGLWGVSYCSCIQASHLYLKYQYPRSSFLGLAESGAWGKNAPKAFQLTDSLELLSAGKINFKGWKKDKNWYTVGF